MISRSLCCSRCRRAATGSESLGSASAIEAASRSRTHFSFNNLASKFNRSNPFRGWFGARRTRGPGASSPCRRSSTDLRCKPSLRMQAPARRVHRFHGSPDEPHGSTQSSHMNEALRAMTNAVPQDLTEAHRAQVRIARRAVQFRRTRQRHCVAVVVSTTWQGHAACVASSTSAPTARASASVSASPEMRPNGSDQSMV